MPKFKLASRFQPTGDQPQAINKLAAGIQAGLKNQVLLGVTGSGKTFTMANIIEKLQMPALIISHNKTLAGQLYQEMRDFFPDNGVSYFVSYYDFYQPEAYVPTTDTYIEKEAQVNELIDKLRLRSTANILTRRDTVVVASVSCIYNIGSPAEYKKFIMSLSIGEKADVMSIARRLVSLQYQRSEFEFRRGSFRIRGDQLDLYPSYEDNGVRIVLEGGHIKKFVQFEPISGQEQRELNAKGTELAIYPAKHNLTDPEIFRSVEQQIRADLEREHAAMLKRGKLTEAERLLRRTNYDLEMIKEMGYVNGMENYSRYFDGRKVGEPPYSLLDYFKYAYGDDFLVFIDESHMTVPQIRGMFNGDHARKKTLIDFGFRLESAFDNRPLKFEEFYRIPSRLIHVSATPDDWEVQQAQHDATAAASSPAKFKEHRGIVEQLVRPTGIVDPAITIRPAKNEVPDLVAEIEKRAAKNEKVLVTTLTKKTAEDLTDYLHEKGLRAAYLHSDIDTLERSNVLDDLRKGEFDALIGVNLLREGLDLPEVTLVAILDADKEGFLRSRTSLVQTMGRAARNISGEVILYADQSTGSIEAAVAEIERRREYQLAYNKKHGITPRTIFKPIREKIVDQEVASMSVDVPAAGEAYTDEALGRLKPEAMTPYDKKRIIKKLEREMKRQADDMHFELAIKIREKIKELKK